MGRRESKGFWDGPVHTAVFKVDNQQGPTYSTGNYTQYFAITYEGNKSEKEYYCVGQKVHLGFSNKMLTKTLKELLANPIYIQCITQHFK